MSTTKFPDGKRFAFTIFDDTDYATVENVRPVYELLLSLGMATTKSVWVLPASGGQGSGCSHQTLADKDYMDFVVWLSRNGFEIAFHNASECSNKREDTISALEYFREVVGYYPKAHANHELNRDNIYWGRDRLDLPLTRAVYKMAKKLTGRCTDFEGHKPGSPYFWGDVCQDRISYVRNFVFRDINLLKVNPTIPYWDPKRPFVRYWFSSCEGADVRSFNELISSGNQARLEKEGGICIVYTHFGGGFVESGRVNNKTTELLTELSGREGWFVPVSTLLDYLLAGQTRTTRSVYERVNMELRWFFSKMVHRTS